VQTTISFEVNSESLLKVTAREEGSGRQVSSEFSTRDTPEAVKARQAQQEPSPAPGGAAASTGAGGAGSAAKKTGVVGWLKGLFGRR
jgi:molecular chaperone DnaK